MKVYNDPIWPSGNDCDPEHAGIKGPWILVGALVAIVVGMVVGFAIS